MRRLRRLVGIGAPDVSLTAVSGMVAGDEDPRGHAAELLGRALAALPAAARSGRVLLRADAGYFAGALARAAFILI